MNTNHKIILEIYLLISILFNYQAFSYGQSVKSITAPCISIEPIGNNIFTFRKDDKAGFMKITETGLEVLCQLSVDYVSDFSEGLSLALKKIGDNYLLYAIITEDFFVRELNFECYVGEFPFFIEGRLPVYINNQKGERKYGYIDRYGELKIPMKYSKAYPFYNGRTLVKDKIGNSYIFSSDGKFFPLTTIFNNKNSEFFSHYDSYKDIDSNISQIIARPKILNGIKGSEMIYQDPKTSLYGYKKKDGEIIIPAQFIHASDFYDDLAIVSLSDKDTRIIRLCPSNISINQKKSNARVARADEECINYTAIISDEIAEGKEVLFRTFFENKILETEMYKENNNTYVCDVVLPKHSRKVQIIIDGIIQKDIIFERLLQDISFSASSTQIRANSAGKANVTFTIENPNDIPISLSFESTGKKAYLKEDQIVVNANDKTRISAYFTGIKNKCTSSVSVSPENLEAKSITIQLIPYL